jgi:hypothetical protein
LGCFDCPDFCPCPLFPFLSLSWVLSFYKVWQGFISWKRCWRLDLPHNYSWEWILEVEVCSTRWKEGVRTSPAVHCLWPCKKKFSHPSLVTYFYTKPLPPFPLKLKLGLEIGERLLIATHLDQPCKSAGANLKALCWAKLAYFDFSSSNFNLQGEILSTSGVALVLTSS